MSGHGPRSWIPIAFILPGLAGAQPGFEGLSNGVRSLKTANAGEIWEQNIEVSGARAPPQTGLVCVEKGVVAPPGQGEHDGDCKVSDVRRSGNKVTWRAACPNGIASEGEMTWQSDTFTGSAKLRGPGMATSMQLRGRKLGGGCDPTGGTTDTEQRKQQNDAMKRMTPAEVSRTCEGWARQLHPMVFVYEECKASRSVYARGVSTRQGFSHLMRSVPQPVADEIFDACGRSRDATLAEICSGTLKGIQPADAWFAQPRRADDRFRSLPDETQERLEFVSRWCPREREQLAQRECAGRQSCSSVSHGEDGDETVCGGKTFARWIYDFCESRLAERADTSHGGTRTEGPEHPGGDASGVGDAAGEQTSSFHAGQEGERQKQEKPPADQGVKQGLIKRGKAIFGF